jgi:hypothetical protein
MSEVTLNELRESFNINISWPKTLGWVKSFDLTNGAGIKFSGRLYWDANDGYTIYWDNDKAPEMADRPEFEYMLDSYTSDPWDLKIPPYGDLSDAGMDGA